MNNYKQHNDFLDLFLLEAQRKFPDARFFKRDNRPVFGRDGRRQKKLRVGEGDAWGILNGKHIEFEIKTGGAKLSEDQKLWKKMVEKAGGFYFIVRPENMDIALAYLGMTDVNKLQISLLG